MSNPAGKSAPRFTRLQKEMALKIVNEHFDIVNDHTLLDIEKALGRRPTAAAVNIWRHGRNIKKRVPPAVDSLPEPALISTTPINTGNDDTTMQQVILAAQKVDEGATTEQLKIVIDRLIAIPKEQIDKLPTKERLRAFQPLSDTWLRRLDIPQQVIDALPQLKEMIAILERLNAKDEREPSNLKSNIQTWIDVIGKAEAQQDKFKDKRLEDLTDADLDELLEINAPYEAYWSVTAEIERREALVIEDDVLDLPELPAGEGELGDKIIYRNINPASPTVTPNGPNETEVILPESSPVTLPEPMTRSAESDPPIEISEAEKLVEAELDRQTKERFARDAEKRQKAREEIEYLKHGKMSQGPLGSAWQLMSVPRKRQLLRDAGLPEDDN